VRQAPFLVLSGTKMPSALVEIGFISHPAESKLLARPAYQERVATALTNAVREFADKVLSRRLVAQVAKNVATTEHAPAAVALPAASAEPPAAVNAVARPDGTR
jgi:hypothetical protein